ncbi:hypothetical protein PF005_g8504 [Phytophthora fragariae]|uniref:Uncharacterized protein n=1 Tax=Phytophthora fragariae TaxID=53985 RepID=A0A6A3U6M2_9STRA|nr:hypothetical protein PF003_g32107 [Phytophthora fragariae]KAE8940357.1 hypothetical protein PF009_g9827 [Phytophthora fragariae]KAE9016208.1 hypothetical protein PF011_g7259 [Phytophthora fragariae]KAE9117176.1 hypothetical protein PF007_g9386 [Phytophthora fragariae]KAE9118413.1 hypothetical protein PF010_g8223 [Phytophthora fragariae]
MYQGYSSCLSLSFLSLSKICLCLIKRYYLPKSDNPSVEVHITVISACSIDARCCDSIILILCLAT